MKPILYRICLTMDSSYLIGTDKSGYKVIITRVMTTNDKGTGDVELAKDEIIRGFKTLQDAVDYVKQRTASANAMIKEHKV